MIKYISRRKFRIFAMDIESHNDSESIAKNETSCWLGSFIDENSKIDDEESYFYSIEEFLEKLKIKANAKPINHVRQVKNICVYIFNLSFEWSFILPVLKKLGYEYRESIDWKNDEYCFNSISTRSCSSVWSVQLKMNKKAGKIIFRDLNKIFSGSLRSVAKAFNLDTQKGEIDYTKNRLHNYQITKEEKEYCFKDTRIIMEILEKVGDDKIFWSSTSAATYSVKNALKYTFPKTFKPYNEFRKLYPELDQEENDFVRESVSGGITYAPERYQFVDIKQDLIHIDLHQAHPSSLALNYFPYGKGTYFQGPPPNKFGISCCRIKISYSGVKLHCVISLIGLPFVEGRILTVWNFEIPLMMKCYEDLTIEYIDGYFYNAKPSPFRRYMKYNYSQRLEAKKNKDAYNTMRFKLLNNSFYGKMIERPHNFGFENIINDDGIITSRVYEKENKEVAGRYAYVPLGSCIPAYTRRTLVGTALKFGYKNIVYFDTDSIFMIKNEETLSVLKTLNLKDELGGWGIEDEEGIKRAQFTAPKRYKLLTGDKLVVKAGGINFDKYMSDRNANLYGADTSKYDLLEDVPFEEINITSEIYEVQRAYRCKGGTLIRFQEKKIDVPKKYQETFNNNVNHAII